jgi:hypothetical protein
LFVVCCSLIKKPDSKSVLIGRQQPTKDVKLIKQKGQARVMTRNAPAPYLCPTRVN